MKTRLSQNRRKDLFKKAMGILSLCVIFLMWQKKDPVSAFQSMPREDFLPLLFTTLAVTLLKVFLLFFAFRGAQKIFRRLKQHRKGRQEKC